MRREGKAIRRLTDRQKPKAMPFLTRQKSMINNNNNNSTSEPANSDLNQASENKINYSAREYGTNDLFENNTVIDNDDLWTFEEKNLLIYK